MIDLPPPPAQQCVSAASPEVSTVKLLITVSGDPAQVAAFLAEIEKYPVWKIQADAHSNGVRFVRLEGPAEVPYREIGGLIFSAQRRQLSASFSAVPPICELKES